jgi:hypothetical protein
MSVEEYSAFLTFMYKNFVLYYDTADCDWIWINWELLVLMIAY